MKKQGMSEKEAIKDTEKWIAVPGTSEHETGLAVDIVTLENQNLDNSQLKSECQKWLQISASGSYQSHIRKLSQDRKRNF